ncbi:MAG: hypothetical protein IJN64_12520 [Lachnospiraceae bacterium]|nr:hypothetical protein [Lachnospiraceae bacterium]
MNGAVFLKKAKKYVEEKIKEAGGMTSEGVKEIVKSSVGTEVNAYLPEYLGKEECKIASKEYVKSESASKVAMNNNGWNLVEMAENENKLALTDGASYPQTYLTFKNEILLPAGNYALKAKVKCSENFRLNDLKLCISPSGSIAASSKGFSYCNHVDYEDIAALFTVTENTKFNRLWIQFYVTDKTITNQMAYIKDVQILQESDINLPHVDDSVIGYMRNFKDKIRQSNTELDISDYEDWMTKVDFPASDYTNIKAIGMPDGTLCYNSPSGRVVIYKLNEEKYFFLSSPKHRYGMPVYIEYESDDFTKPSNVVISYEAAIEGVIKFKESTKYVAICGHNSWDATLKRLPNVNALWREDLYPYEEVLKEGYLPNPDSGIMDWDRWGATKEHTEMINNIFDEFVLGQYYNRYRWAEVYNSETGTYDFSGIKASLENCIANKTRAQLGVFSSLYPGEYDSYTEYDDKVVYYNMPKFVYDLAYEAETFPLKLIQYNSATFNGKPAYNAVIDWRNEDVFNAFKDALTQFSNFLDSESSIGVPYRKIVASIQIRFFGKYGEGHNGELFAQYPNDLENVETLKSVVDLYIELFDDIRLIAPVDGKGSTTVDLGLAEWQKYYFTAENSVGKFGFFNDHIGAALSFTDVKRNFDGVNLLDEFCNRYKEAPMTGEVFNNGEYDKNLLTMQYLLNDTMSYRYNTMRWTNVTGESKTPNYNHPSVKRMFQKAYDMCGYRIFFLPISAYIANSKVNVKFRVGNMGLTPCYGDYWNAQLVVRNSKGEEIQVIDNIFDCRTVNMMPEPMKPSWKYTDVVSISKSCLSNVDYTNAKFYIRVVDTVGISNNMYLSNIDRTEIGEYLLFK